MEPDKIDILSFAMLRDLEQVDETQKSRLARQSRRDIRETDGLDGIYFDLTFFHAISFAYSNVWTRPYSDAASDFSAANAVAKPLGEHHDASLPLANGNLSDRHDLAYGHRFKSLQNSVRKWQQVLKLIRARAD